MELKEKLVKLFQDTCNDFEVPRQDDYLKLSINSTAREKIIKWFDEQILTEFSKYPLCFEDYDFNSYVRGFNFKEQPPIVVASIDAKYSVKYGILFPIIGYLFINNYKRRKSINNQVLNLIVNNRNFKDWWCDTLEKRISFKQQKFFILQGSLVEEITHEEYSLFVTEYKLSVNKYDIHMLDKRLKKK